MSENRYNLKTIYCTRHTEMTV